jgi:ABC-2 type transport system permease protein
MKVLVNQIKLESRLFLRDRGELFWALAFPIFFIVLFGLIYQGESWDGMPPITFITPGIITMAVMVTCIMNTTMGFTGDRGKGIFRRLSITPLKRQTLIGGQIVARYLIILVQTVLLIVVGVSFFEVTIGGNYFLFWIALTIGSLAFLAMAFALTTLIKTEKSTIPVSMTFFFILLFLGGCLFPVDIMPKFIQYVYEVLPSAHLNEAFRAISIDEAGFGTVWPEFLKLGGWAVVFSVIAVKFFRWE